MHSGDINEEMIPLGFCPSKADKAVINVAKEVVKRMPVGIRIPSISINGLYSYAVKKGSPSVLLEIGGAGRWILVPKS